MKQKRRNKSEAELDEILLEEYEVEERAKKLYLQSYNLRKDDPEKAKKLYEEVLSFATADAWHSLAEEFDRLNDRKEKLFCYRKAAEMGDTSARVKLACILTESVDAAERIEGMKWFRKAAETGVPDACLIYGYELGDKYWETSEHDEGVRFLQKAGENGCLDAVYGCGAVLRRSDNSKEKRDEGFKWLLYAAELNHEKAYRELTIAFFMSDDGSLQDRKRTFDLICSRTEKELDERIAGRIAQDFAHGNDCVSPDLVKAEKWFKRAASRGNPNNIYLLSEFYQETGKKFRAKILRRLALLLGSEYAREAK